MALFGQSSGPVAPLDPQVLNAKGSLFLTRPTISHYIATREELLWRAQDISRLDRRRRVARPRGQDVPAGRGAAAHQYLEDRKTQGKVLLLPW